MCPTSNGKFLSVVCFASHNLSDNLMENDFKFYICSFISPKVGTRQSAEDHSHNLTDCEWVVEGDGNVVASTLSTERRSPRSAPTVREHTLRVTQLSRDNGRPSQTDRRMHARNKDKVVITFALINSVVIDYVSVMGH